MSQPMSAAQWLAALRAEGITDIVEMPGWKTHNRNEGRAWGEVHGVAIHHTAGVGTGMADYCYRGSAALPGPLCQDFLAKDGTLYLVGNGRCNHAGTIAANAHQAFADESFSQKATFKPDAQEPYDGNRELYGLEIENRGDGIDPYPQVQYDVAVRWAAARCRVHGWTSGSVAGHKEVTRRKTDPSFSMPLFRVDVDARLNSHSPSEGPDMAITNADVVKILTTDGIVPAPSTAPDRETNPFWNVASHLATVTSTATRALDEVRQLRGQVEQQDTMLLSLMQLLREVSAKLDAQ